MFKMEKTVKGQEAESPVVFEVDGEPAVVINGLPKNISCNKKPVVSCVGTCDKRLADDPVFGELLEGRKVKKLFGGQYYQGEVVKYDSEVNWYKVVYEDGDSEDLEWHELEEILLPLDINIPLKLLPFQSCLQNKYFLEPKIRKSSHPFMEKTLEPCQISQQIYEVPIQIDYKAGRNWGHVRIQTILEE
ncbi:dirigent protein 17-like [Dendrobium catenatum]|nr:dirigent protein 17-like [Dendrobium catenatum]